MEHWQRVVLRMTDEWPDFKGATAYVDTVEPEILWWDIPKDATRFRITEEGVIQFQVKGVVEQVEISGRIVYD